GLSFKLADTGPSAPILVSCLRHEYCNYEIRPRSVGPWARDPLHLAKQIETGVQEVAFSSGA
ncbi:hypothetical protein PISMIDRAFT_688187, partial [Pisolithus microcarpus 441]